MDRKMDRPMADRLNRMNVAAQNEVAPGIYRLDLRIPQGKAWDIQAGQFFHIRCAEETMPLLRRPVSLADYDSREGRICLLYRVEGIGTSWLSRRRVGEEVDVLGPLGRGFPMPGDVLSFLYNGASCEHGSSGSRILLNGGNIAAEPSANEEILKTGKFATENLDAETAIAGKPLAALLIGGGIGIPPLYYLAKQLLKQGVRVSVILGFASKEQSFLIEAFQSLSEVYLASEDGSLGRQGRVTDWLEVLHAGGNIEDFFYACGPVPMLLALQKHYRKLSGENQVPFEAYRRPPEGRPIAGYLSLEARMGCGVGACLACVCPAAPGAGGKNYRKICSDGPVFDYRDIVLKE